MRSTRWVSVSMRIPILLNRVETLEFHFNVLWMSWFLFQLKWLIMTEAEWNVTKLTRSQGLCLFFQQAAFTVYIPTAKRETNARKLGQLDFFVPAWKPIKGRGMYIETGALHRLYNNIYIDSKVKLMWRCFKPLFSQMTSRGQLQWFSHLVYKVSTTLSSISSSKSSSVQLMKMP